MTLGILSDSFADCETLLQLEDLIEGHVKLLRLSYYGLDGIQLRDRTIEIETSFYLFKACAGYRAFESSDQKSEQIHSMLVFYASLFERTSNNANYNIVSILPSCSVKYRLKASLLADEINHLPTHYTKNFVDVLNLLAKSQFDLDNDYTAVIISFLVRYYHTATAKLAARGYFNEIAELQAAYTSEFLLREFPFLDNPLIREIVNGNTTIEEELEVVKSKSVLYYPSQIAQKIFERQIIEPVRTHPATTPFSLLLGYSSLEARESIIQYGRADFSAPYKNLSAAERVLLYCYFNMRKHFFTSFFVFERIYEAVWKNLEQTKTTPVCIDLGCGPLTSALALADLALQRVEMQLEINYIGIDISEAMLKKADAFWHEGVRNGLIASTSKRSFYKSWRDITEEILEEYVALHNPIFINASYLFASSSLNEYDLAEFVNLLVNQNAKGKVYFVFQNPNRLDRNEKFNNFKSYLQRYETVDKNVERVYYKNNPNNSSEPSPEDVYYEILNLN